MAYANEPIVIKNKFLGYIVNYNLQNFKVQHETPSSGFQFITSTYYDGFTCFEELKKSARCKNSPNNPSILKHKTSYITCYARFPQGNLFLG